MSSQSIKFNNDNTYETFTMFSKVFNHIRSMLLVKDPKGKEVERFWEKEFMWSHRFGYIVEPDGEPSLFLAMRF